MADRIGQLWGNYRLVRSLGRGGFAEVYLGEHIYLQSQAALKLLFTFPKDKNVERFRTEAKILAGLRHPHIVRMLEFTVNQEMPVLIMDYAPGGTARQRHAKGSRVPLATAIAYVKQVAAALQYAHDRNIIHRDVKPDNILFDSDGQILLSDFGLALLVPSLELLSTQEGAGTYLYTPPEQLDGKPTFTSDQYTLGIVIYEWLSGTTPFTGSLFALGYQHREAPPPSLRASCPWLPAAVEEVVFIALAKDPQQRFRSVQAFANALEIASREGIQARSPKPSLLRPQSLPPHTSDTPSGPQATYRVFLTSAPADAAFAARLQADLHARGVLITYDDAEHPSNANQQYTLREAIREMQLTLVVVSPHTRSSRAIQERLRIAGMYQRRMVFVRATGDDLVETLPEAWGRTAMIDLVDARGTRYMAALGEIMALLRELTPTTSPEEPTLPVPQGEPRNPFKGLRAFRERDASDFFGRDTLIAVLAETIEDMLKPTTPATRLLTVIGPSGSGKSSVVMAGLLPALQRNVLPGSEDWVYLEPVVPGKHPLESLVRALAPQLPQRSLRVIREDLEDDAARGLHLLTTQLIKQPGDRVVLTIDQFEELFTLTVSEKERQRLIDLLVTAITEPDGPLMVLLTLRADFYDRPMHYPQLSRLIETHHKSVLPMGIHELRAVIERPALLPDVQLIFEGNLVGDLLFEMQGQAGALPLLEFTLEQLFERRDGHFLTLEAYRKIGGLKGALAKHAEATYTSLPSEEYHQMARTLFLRLINPGITEQDTTRRRASIGEFSLSSPEQTTIMRATINAFVTARLLTMNEVAGSSTIEVSHEALIREWTRLSAWLREAREDISLQLSISTDVADWIRRGKPVDRVYRDTQLVEAQAWAERNVPSTDEVAFLQASFAEHQQQEALEQSRQVRELNLQHRVVSRQRILITALSIFSVIVIVLASVAGLNFLQAQTQQRLAEMEALNARSRALAADANSVLLQKKLDLALLLSVKAYKTANTPEARDSLLSALEQSPHIVKMLRGESIDINALAFGSAAGALLSSDTNGVYLWDMSAREKPPHPLILDGKVLGNAAFSTDGRMLVTSNNDGVWLWSIEANLQPSRLPLPTNILPNTPNNALAFSPDGTLVGSGRCSQYSSDGSTCLATQIFVWKMLSKQHVGLPFTFTIPTAITSLAFSPDNTKLASISQTGMQLWSVSTGQLSSTSFIDKAAVNTLAFSPDGTELASGDADNTIRLWNVVTGLMGSSFVGHIGAITSLAFSPDGTKLASGSMDNTVILWEVKTGHPIDLPLIGHTSAITRVAFSSNGQMLASGSADGMIILWNVNTDNTLSQRIGVAGGLESPLFSPDGRAVLTGDEKGKAFLQNTKNGGILKTFDTVAYYPTAVPQQGEDQLRFPFSIQSLALSQTGILATGRLDGTVILWNLKTGGLVAHFQYSHLLRKIMLSSDGKTVAAAGDGGFVTLWDVTSRSPIHSFRATDYQWSSLPIPVALSPDGKFLAAGGCKVLAGGSCTSAQVVLWDVKTGTPVNPPFLGQQSIVLDVAFSPDGHTLAASSQDGIALWDVATRNRSAPILSILDNRSGSVPNYYTNIAFNSDGTMLVSYSSTGTAFSFVLWNVAGKEAFALPIYEDNYSQGSVAFSPNRHQLASVVLDSSGKVIFSLWDITIPLWLSHACTIANRDLNKEEWKQFVQDGVPSTVCPA